MTKHTTHNTRHMPHDTHTRTRINEFRLRSCSVNWLNKSLYHITSHITYHTLTRHHTCTHPTHDRHHMVGIQDRSMSDRPVNQSHGVFNHKCENFIWRLQIINIKWRWVLAVVCQVWYVNAFYCHKQITVQRRCVNEDLIIQPRQKTNQ